MDEANTAASPATEILVSEGKSEESTTVGVGAEKAVEGVGEWAGEESKQQWACAACTYLNEALINTCTVCQARRPGNEFYDEPPVVGPEDYEDYEDYEGNVSPLGEGNQDTDIDIKRFNHCPLLFFHTDNIIPLDKLKNGFNTIWSGIASKAEEINNR